MDAAHELLLSKVGRFYERHNASRQGRTDFNVFTALRSSGDEVNLHSRFLYAVLNWTTPDGKLENLRDFVTKIAGVQDFRLEGAKVGRETHNIDLLIEENDKNDETQRQAIVIENKIWAGDQEQQLQRYKQKLVDLGYHPSAIHLRYLTPFGTEPSGQSIGDLECKTISYRDDLPPWLERCQQRAMDHPSLRESIAQYLQLIRDITGTDSEAYMSDLKKLCRKDDNLLLTHDLSQAFVEVQADLVACLWEDIDRALRKAIDDLPKRDPEWADRAKSSAVKDCINGKRSSWSGLCYRITEGAWLSVVADSYLWFGVSCDKDTYRDQHQMLLDTLSEVASRHDSSSTTPWYHYPSDGFDLRNLNHDNLRMLNSKTTRSQFAQVVSAQMVKLWQQARRACNLEPT